MCARVPLSRYRPKARSSGSPDLSSIEESFGREVLAWLKDRTPEPFTEWRRHSVTARHWLRTEEGDPPAGYGEPSTAVPGPTYVVKALARSLQDYITTVNASSCHWSRHLLLSLSLSLSISFKARTSRWTSGPSNCGPGSISVILMRRATANCGPARLSEQWPSSTSPLLTDKSL